MQRENLCDQSHTYIAVKGRISVTCTNKANRRNKKLTFKNSVPFRYCISKTNNTFVDNAEDVNIVMPMYKFLEYIGNYCMTLGSLRNYNRDETIDDENEINDNGNKTNNNKASTDKSFKYKTNLIGNTPNNNSRLKAGNFQRSLDLPLISCETEHDLSWSIERIISEVSRTFTVVPNSDPVE